MWCPEISFSRILCKGPVLYPEEIYDIVSYLISVSMSFYITFKKKTLACGSQEGHMWVTSGHLWVSGSPSVTRDPLSTLLPAIMRSGPHAAGLPNATYSVLIRRTLIECQTCTSYETTSGYRSSRHFSCKPRSINGKNPPSTTACGRI